MAVPVPARQLLRLGVLRQWAPLTGVLFSDFLGGQLVVGVRDFDGEVIAAEPTSIDTADMRRATLLACARAWELAPEDAAAARIRATDDVGGAADSAEHAVPQSGLAAVAASRLEVGPGGLR